MPPRIFDYRDGQVGRLRRTQIYVGQRVDAEDRGIKHAEQLEKVIGYEFDDLTLAARALDLVGYYASDHEAPDSPSHRLAWEGDTMLDLVLKRAWRKLGIFSRCKRPLIASRSDIELLVDASNRQRRQREGEITGKPEACENLRRRTEDRLPYSKTRWQPLSWRTTQRTPEGYRGRGDHWCCLH